MNEERRKRLTEAKGLVQKASNIVTDVAEEERRAAERHHASANKADELDELIKSIDDVWRTLNALSK